MTMHVHTQLLTLSIAEAFIYLKKWSKSQCSNNDKLMEGVEMWLGKHTVDLFTQAFKKLFPDTSASIPAVAKLISSLKVAVSAILSKKAYMYMSYSECFLKWQYFTVQFKIVDKKVILSTVSNISIYYSSDKVSTV
jgi:hypothetical protein